MSDLDGQGVESETRTLDQFYDWVRVRAAGATGAAGKKAVTTQLCERCSSSRSPK